jgi:hypothetical protein
MTLLAAGKKAPFVAAFSGTPEIFLNGNFYKGDLDKESVLAFVDRIPS